MIRTLFKSSFFRQSAWLLMATVANSALLAAVNVVTLGMDGSELGAFTSLMDVMAQLSIPITGVLVVFMHQTVTAITDELRRQLVSLARGIILGLCGLWLVVAVGAALFQSRVMETLKLPDAAGWWLTLLAGLTALITPAFTGILQGEQKFLQVGVSYMVNGFGRLVGVLIAVFWLHLGASGAMTGVLMGNLLTLIIVVWSTRWIWSAPSEPCDWRSFLRQAIPLTLGLAAPTYVFTQDMFVVQEHFSVNDSAAYSAPRVVGRMLFFLVGPMTAVMFPKIARSAATSEKTNVLAQAVGATALVCGGTALACTLFPQLMLLVLTLGKTTYSGTARLIPWFAWALMPLALSNLLVNNLMARKRFEAVPWLLAVAAGYGITIRFMYQSYESVIRTLGAFSLLLFLVCVVFTLRKAPGDQVHP